MKRLPRDRLAADARVVEAVADERRDALGVHDVGGEERLHLRADVRDRLRGGLPAPERGRDLLGDAAQAVVAQAEDELEVALRGGHVAGHVERLRALEVLVGGQPELVDLEAEVRRLALGVVQQLEERGADLAVGVLDHRGDVAVVVLEPVLLGAVAAAVDADRQQDEHEQGDAERHDLARPCGLAVRRRGARAAAAPARGGGRTPRPGRPAHACGLVTLVEERQKAAPCSSCGRTHAVCRSRRIAGAHRPR